MSAQPKPEPKKKVRHPALEPTSGPQLNTYALIRAVYMDEFDRAKSILAADPDQINRPDPFAGLTPLHIAIFRQNTKMVQLLVRQPECKATIRDNFGRLALDLLAYTSEREIFDAVMNLSVSEIERLWTDEALDAGRASGQVVAFRPRPKNDKP